MSNRLDAGFAERVLEEVAAGEAERQRTQRVALLMPVLAIVVVGVAWAISLTVGVSVVRQAIEVLAWLSAVGQLERHLSTALLGPFAPLPLVVSLLLFLAALAWVRTHQPDPPEVPW